MCNRSALLKISTATALVLLLVVGLYFYYASESSPANVSPSVRSAVGSVDQPAAHLAGGRDEPGNTYLPPVDDLLHVPRDKLASHVEELITKGYPVISAPRQAAYNQVANKSLEEVAADMGNVFHRGYTLDGDVAMARSSLTSIAHTLPPSLYVLRLIEEGRENPGKVSAIVEKQIEAELDRYQEIVDELQRDDSSLYQQATVAQNDSYYGEHFRYKDSPLELDRLTHTIYSGFYVLANIDRMGNDQLFTKWINLNTKHGYGSLDMDVWLLEQYVNQGGLKNTGSAEKYRELVGDRQISIGYKDKSRWDELWDADNPLLKLKDVDTTKFKKIEVLNIPDRLPLNEGEPLKFLLQVKEMWK